MSFAFGAIALSQMQAEPLLFPVFCLLALAVAGGAVVCLTLGSLEATEFPRLPPLPALPAFAGARFRFSIRFRHPARFAYLLTSSLSAFLCLMRLVREAGCQDINGPPSEMLWVSAAFLACCLMVSTGWQDWFRRPAS